MIPIPNLDLGLSGQMSGGNDQSSTVISPSLSSPFTNSHVINADGTGYKMNPVSILLWLAVGAVAFLIVRKFFR
jgi:hypothetical protein